MFRIFLASVALAAFGSQTMAAAPKPKKSRPPKTIEIVNQRAVKLEAFSLAAADKPDKILAKLAKPVPAGEKVKLSISNAKACGFVATWKFADAGDQAEVDLCNDPKIVLTD